MSPSPTLNLAINTWPHCWPGFGLLQFICLLHSNEFKKCHKYLRHKSPAQLDIISSISYVALWTFFKVPQQVLHSFFILCLPCSNLLHHLDCQFEKELDSHTDREYPIGGKARDSYASNINFKKSSKLNLLYKYFLKVLSRVFSLPGFWIYKERNYDLLSYILEFSTNKI